MNFLKALLSISSKRQKPLKLSFFPSYMCTCPFKDLATYDPAIATIAYAAFSTKS